MYQRDYYWPLTNVATVENRLVGSKMLTDYGDPPNQELPSHRTLTYRGPGATVIIDCMTCQEKYGSVEEHVTSVQGVKDE